MQRSLSPIQLLEEMAKNQTGKSDIECKLYKSATDVLDLTELTSDKKNLAVFDDSFLERKKTNAELITPEVGTATWIVFTWHRTILDSRVKLYEKTQTLFACSDKI